MTRYVAFLRGMNVGGHRITNAELCAAFETIGMSGAATFRASGNVIFDAPTGDSRDTLVERIEQGLERILGYAVPVFLRDAAETRAIAASEPFSAAELARSQGKLQVMLLTTAPRPPARKRILAHANDDDRLAIAGRELYWLPRGGMSDSELDLDAIGRLLDGLTTVRTMGTIELIAAKYLADD